MMARSDLANEFGDLPDLPSGQGWADHALFLDFDGTLAALADDPASVRLSPEMRTVLPRLVHRTDGAIAILSGRALTDLAGRTENIGAVLSGSHGAEIRWPDGRTHPLPETRAELDNAFAELSDFARAHDLRIERKPGAVALHYRTRPGMAAQGRAAVDRAVAANPALRAIHGNMVSETAIAGLDKGCALRRLMSSPPFRGRRPVMAGDDRTDEDAIAAAQAMGGLGLRIGPGATAARVRFNDMAAFQGWLARSAAKE